MAYSQKKVGGKQTLKVGNSSDNNELVEHDLLGLFSQKTFSNKTSYSFNCASNIDYDNFITGNEHCTPYGFTSY
jgi:hypothetical protein